MNHRTPRVALHEVKDLIPSRSIAAFTLSLALFAACAGNPEPDPELIEVPVRAAPPLTAVKPGDCPEALRRAAANPDLDVDRLARPHASVPSALPVKSMPTAVRKAKYNEVRVKVMIDTLGKPDMKTFAVVKTTHPWLATSFHSAIAKWTFDPAMLAGCKVPRLWFGAITSGKPPASGS